MDIIYGFLFSLTERIPYPFTRVMPENRELFLSVIKSFIKADHGRDKGFFLELASDYSSVRKIMYRKKKL